MYLFRDGKARVIYVGKAKSIRKRVASHFAKAQVGGRGSGSSGHEEMVASVERIECVVVGSEVEALLAEQGFIKQYRPRFNIRLRDDKSYPFIAISLDEDYPRVYFTRERHRPGRAYFGPYSNAKRVRSTLEVLAKVFMFRSCTGPEPGRRSGSPCLDYYIKRCEAPCVGYVSKEDYRKSIDGVIDFLSGRFRTIERDLEERMRAAAAAEEFEQATLERNRLRAVHSLLERRRVANESVGTLDAVAVAVAPPGGTGGREANAQVFQVRDGVLSDRQSFYLSNETERDVAEVAEEFMLQFYAAHVSIPPLLIVQRELVEGGEAAALAEALALGLDVPPIRIECFDISHLGGTQTVASMVVFEGGAPKKSDYRRFTIRTLEDASDDYAAMAEVLSRRFAQWERQADISPHDPEYNASFAALPNVIVIDGGKGQLAAGLGPLRGFRDRGVAVVSLAKRIEELFIPGRAAPLVLDHSTPELQLLQRVRDEAHRFAITHHRTRRDKAMTTSLLDELPGVGPARKRALLAHFGSPDAVVVASREELQAVPGLPAKVARELHGHLHRAG